MLHNPGGWNFLYLRLPSLLMALCPLVTGGVTDPTGGTTANAATKANPHRQRRKVPR